MLAFTVAVRVESLALPLMVSTSYSTGRRFARIANSAVLGSDTLLFHEGAHRLSMLS